MQIYFLQPSLIIFTRGANISDHNCAYTQCQNSGTLISELVHYQPGYTDNIFGKYKEFHTLKKNFSGFAVNVCEFF